METKHSIGSKDTLKMNLPMPSQPGKQQLQVVWCDPTHNYRMKSNNLEFSDFELMLVAFFKCSVYDCSFYSNDKKRFVKHLQKHEGHTLYCVYCDNPNETNKRIWKADEEYAEHLVSCHGHRVYQCNKCVYRTRSKVFLEMHLSNGHPQLNSSRLADDAHFSTEDCVLKGPCLMECANLTENEIRRLITNRQKERKSTTSMVAGRLQCLYCDESTADRHLLLLHMCRSHLDAEAIYIDFLSPKLILKQEKASETTKSPPKFKFSFTNRMNQSNEENDGQEETDSESDDCEAEYSNYFDPATIERPQYAKVLRNNNSRVNETETAVSSASTTAVNVTTREVSKEKRLFNIGKRKRISHAYKERREAMVIDEMECDVPASRRLPSNVLRPNMIRPTPNESASTTNAETTTTDKADQVESSANNESAFPCRQRPQRLPIPTSRRKELKTYSSVLTPNISRLSLQEKLLRKTLPVPLSSTQKIVADNKMASIFHQEFAQSRLNGSTKPSTNSFELKRNENQELITKKSTPTIHLIQNVRHSIDTFTRSKSLEDIETVENGRRRRTSETGKLQRMRAKCGKSFAANTNLFGNHGKRDSCPTSEVTSTEKGIEASSTTSPVVKPAPKVTSKSKKTTDAFLPKPKRQCASDEKSPTNTLNLVSTSTNVGSLAPKPLVTLNRTDCHETTHSTDDTAKYFCLFCEVHNENFDLMRDHVLKHLFDYQCTYCHFSDPNKQVVEQHQLIRHSETKKLNPNADSKQPYLNVWVEKFLKVQHSKSEFESSDVSNMNRQTILQCPICIKSAIIVLKLPRTFDTLTQFKDHFYEHSCWEILVREAALNNQYDNASSFLKKTIEHVEQAYTDLKE
jgi:hypothetical protein